jgi:multiple sugar transport system substrate-binding protein
MSRRLSILMVAALLLTAVLFLYLGADDGSHYVMFSTWGTPAEVGSFQRLIDYYNTTRQPKHKVKLSHSEHTSYTELLLVKAAARDLPDVIHIDRKDLPLFVHRGLLEELTTFVNRDTSFDLGIFLPQLLPGCRVGNRLYAVPHNFSTMVLYYNKDHFDAAGIPYPDSSWTWDTLLRAARRLTKRDAAGTIVRYGCHVHIILHTMMYQNGGRVLNETLDSCVIASPEVEQALQFDIDLSEKYGVTWNILAQNLQWDDMFAGGRLSMIANGRWAAAWYLRSMPDGAMDIAPLPRGKFRKGAMVNHMMAISAESARKDEAWEFITFLVSDEAQRMFNDDGANIPAVRSIVYSDAFLHNPKSGGMNNQVFLDEVRSSAVWPFDQGPFLTHHVLQSETDLVMRRILLGQATTMQSLKIMEDNVNRIIALQRSVPEPRPFVGSLLFYLCLGVPTFFAAVMVRHQRRKHAHEA